MGTYTHVLPLVQRQASEQVAGSILRTPDPGGESSRDHSRDHSPESGGDASVSGAV